MPPISHIAVYALTGLFLLGCAGAVVTIPIVAIRFVSVLFEPDPEEDAGATPEGSAA